MRPRCRLCDQRVVGDSIFCAKHRDQAQRFSLSFGKQEDSPESPPPEGPAPPDVPEPDSDDEPAGGPVESPTPDSAKPLDVAPVATANLDEERAVLAAAFHPAFDELRTRLKEHADAERWPQLSIYFLDDTLYCRAYFSILPRTEDTVPAPVFALHEDRVHASLAAGGIVFEELYTCYSEHTEALRNQKLQTIDVHFLTYAGLIAINSHPPGGKMQNLVTLKLKGDAFRKIEIDDDVRTLMRHDHW